MRRVRAALAAFFLAGIWLGLPALGWAQGAIQGVGVFTPGHIAMYAGQGQFIDAGGPTIAGGTPQNTSLIGTRPSGLGIVNAGLGNCQFSAYAGGPYAQLCTGFDGAGGVLFTIDGFNGATNPGFNVRLNGTTYPFPGAGNGNMVGPNSSTVGDLAIWNNTAGSLTKNLAADAVTGMRSLLKYGAVCDGATNDATAFTNAVAGGGTVVLPQGLTCAIASTLTMPSNAHILLPPGSTIKWTGAGNGTMFQTSGSTPTNNVGIMGLGGVGTIDPNGQAGTIFDFNSGWKDVVSDLEILNASATSTLLKLHADAGTASGDGAHNHAYGTYRNVNATGTVGTCVSLAGTTSAGAKVVTLNHFLGLKCGNVQVKGADFQQWADTNYFNNSYFQINGSGAAGIVFNSATPTLEDGIYQNTFRDVAVDCFGSGLNRTGIVFGFSRLEEVRGFENNPPCENGVYTTTNDGAGSYELTYNDGSAVTTTTQNVLWKNPPYLTNNTFLYGLGSGGVVEQLLGVTSTNRTFIGAPSGGIIEMDRPGNGTGFSFVLPTVGTITAGISFAAGTGTTAALAAAGSATNIGLSLSGQGSGGVTITSAFQTNAQVALTNLVTSNAGAGKHFVCIDSVTKVVSEGTGASCN